MSGYAGLKLQPDPTRYTLPCFLEDVVERQRDRVALSFEGADVTYGELREQVHALARGLAAVGVGKGTHVALHLTNRPEWVVAAFAVARVGGVIVPISTFAKTDELDYILRHSDAAVVLMQRALGGRDLVEELIESHPELLDSAPGAARCTALPQLRRVHCFGLEAPRGCIEGTDALQRAGRDVAPELVDAMAASVTPSDDGVLIYTSGTTAHPKGVLHYQRAPVIMSWRYAELYELEPEDVMWTAQPFFWTAGMAMSLGAALASGARLILEERFDAGRALEIFERERVTAPWCWPHQEKALAEHPSIAERDLRSLSRVNFASPLAQHAGIEKDEWGFRGSYGMSETFTLATAFPATAPAALRTASSGPPLPGMHVRIVDPETGATLPPGEKGEIAVKGITFMRGYYKVAPDMYLDSEGFFHTQDGGFIDSAGYLHWEGRLSNIIKTGGANVSPLEIEAKLEELPGLHYGQAVGVPHPELGEAIVLCVVPAEGHTIDVDALRAHLRSKLAAYKVPREILVFAEGELSFTANQKVQLAPLREAALARLEADGTEILGTRYGA